MDFKQRLQSCRDAVADLVGRPHDDHTGSYLKGLAIGLSAVEDLINEHDKLLAEGDVDKTAEKAGHIQKILGIVEDGMVYGK